MTCWTTMTRTLTTPPSTMVNPEYESVLTEAAGFIARNGWCQGQGALPSGECCLARAISMAAGDTVLAIRVCAYLREKRGLPPTFQFATWNDEPGRTKEEVIVMLVGL